MKVSCPVADRIREQVALWPDVRVETYPNGMIFFYVGRRELGHLHGDQLADLPFPVRIRKKLVAEGRTERHYLHPKTGWTTYYIHDAGDVEPVVELFRLNYGRPWLNRPAEAPGDASQPGRSRAAASLKGPQPRPRE